jgi:MFS transporter, DHA2 family, multidrug resistance protein
MPPKHEDAPLRGWRLFLTVFAINVAAFLEILDLSIVNASVPAVAGTLGATQSEATWAISAYALGAAVIQPVTGWLTRRFGEVRLFMGSTALFTFASALCGAAPTLESLVLFRLLQGIVSGPMFPLSQSLMWNIVPERWHGIAQGVWGMVVLVAPVCGPLLGGWLTDEYSWRWAFYINVPLGIGVVSILWTFLGHKKEATERIPVDVAGFILLFLGVGALQVAFDNGHQKDWFESSFIVVTMIVSAVALLLFTAWERYERYPVVDFTYFLRRNFWPSVAAIALGYGALIGVLVTYNLWLQTTIGYSATLAGLAQVPFGVAAIITAALMGVFSARIPLRTTATVAFVLFAAGSVWLAFVPADATFWQLSAPRVLHGIASPLFFIMLSDIKLSGLPPERLAGGTSLSSFVRTLAMSLFTALSVTAWDQRADTHHILFAERTSPMFLSAVAPSANGGPAPAPVTLPAPAAELSMLDAVATLKARTLAFHDVCWLSAMVFLLAIPLIWIPRGPFVRGRAAGTH